MNIMQVKVSGVNAGSVMTGPGRAGHVKLGASVGL